MNRVQIFILILFSTGAGIGIYLYIKKKKEQQASQEAIQSQDLSKAAFELSLEKKKFCNPPITNIIEKMVYQRDLAKIEWEKRGKGMDLNYFIDQYKKEMGCP